jgi:hypothetical protein
VLPASEVKNAFETVWIISACAEAAGRPR